MTEKWEKRLFTKPSNLSKKKRRVVEALIGINLKKCRYRDLLIGSNKEVLVEING